MSFLLFLPDINQPTATTAPSAHMGMNTVVTARSNTSKSVFPATVIPSLPVRTYPSEMPIGTDIAKQTAPTILLAVFLFNVNFCIRNCVITSSIDMTDVIAAMATIPKKKNEIILPTGPKVLNTTGSEENISTMPLFCNAIPVSA